MFLSLLKKEGQIPLRKRNDSNINKGKKVVLLNVDKNNTKEVHSVKLFIVILERINLMK